MTSPGAPDPGLGSYQQPYPYPPGQFPPERPQRATSGWAIAAFVLGFVSCVPLGLIFGIVALVNTKGGRQSGRGLAIAGIVLSGLWTLGGVILGVIVAFAVLNEPLITGTVNSSPLVMVGECFNPDINTSVSCAQPHSDEVFAVLSLSRFPDGPDDQELENRCRAELGKYSPSASRDPRVQVAVWGPGTDWKYMDNHTAACAAHFTPNRVGSIKG